jgi:chromosomal replication initiation ATPase DnaA
MEIVSFNKKSALWIEKYAPTNLSEYIGSNSSKQVYAITDWLKKYKTNRIINLKKQESKKGGKNGKKPRKKRVKKSDEINEEEEIIDLDIDIDIDGDEDENLDKEKDQDQDNEIALSLSNKKKKKEPGSCSCVLVTGDHGCGKTSLVRAILNDMGYVIRTVNFTRVSTIKRIDDFVNNLLSGENVYNIIQGELNSQIAVVIDEIESISTPTEKNIIDTILKTNNEIWACPVIFIANRKHKKIINNVKDDSYHIAMYEPDINHMMKLLLKIGVAEKMKLEDENIAYAIIEYSQHDYRRMIILMQELKRLHGNDIITKEELNTYISYSDERNVDYTINENTNKLFSEYKDINHALRIFESDKINMPLMVQQNHFMALSRYSKNNAITVGLASDLAANIAIGDIIDNYIYSDQNWSLQETHGFYTCVYPSYMLNKNIHTDKLSADSKTPIYLPTFRPDYPRDLNKTSTRRINYKNVKFASKYFKNMSISDYIYQIKMMKNLIDDNRIEECKKLLDGYNAPLSGILYVIKIDKINGTKKEIPKGMEKKLKEVSTEPPQMIRTKKLTK